MPPVVKAMTRLGMVRVTLLMTLASAFMSLGVAWAFTLVVPMTEARLHLVMAFAIPFVVTPGFSWMTALSMRESRRARREAFDMARRDPLTGLFNRRSLFDAEAEGRGLTPGAACRTALFLDIDHFKRVNDTYGHAAGDAVLRHLAQILQRSSRRGDLVARIGGEEFVVVLPECAGPGAESLGARILGAVRAARLSHGGVEIRYTVSIGAARASAGQSLDELLAEADAQLYRAKQDGRNGMSQSFPPSRGEPTPRAAAPLVRSAA